MTFDQAQGTFRRRKSCETACAYLAIASRRKADATISTDTLFNAVGEVANWLSAPDEQLKVAKSTMTIGTTPFEDGMRQKKRCADCGCIEGVGKFRMISLLRFASERKVDKAI
jgi:hypothetical protein